MALKRLHTEVDKTVREVRACLDTYDERWQELLEFNRQFVQRKEQLVDEARKEVIRGKKHSVRTATLELMDYKHVNDAKAKIEADLEGALRKLHRHKQQLSDWIHNYSDKDIRNKDALTELRKCIELRYKRGRVFYSQGQSSFPVSGPGSSQGGLASSSSVEAVQWMPSLIEALSGQIETWEGELLLLRQGKQCGTHSSRSTSGSTATSPEARSSASSSGRSSNAKGRNSRRGGTANAEDASSVCGMAGTSLSQQKEGAAVGERIAQLSAMVELHRLHIDHLERLLRAVRREELAGDDERLEELRDVLDPYVHSNSNMVIVVPEEIYQDLELQESLPGTCIAPVETAVGRPCAHDEDGKREPSRAHQTGPGTSASSCDNCEAPLAGMNDTGTQISVIDTRKRSRTRAKDEMDQVVAGESSTKDCRGRTHCPDGSGQGHLNVRSSPVSASSGAEVRAGGGGSSSAPAPSRGATPWGTGASGGGGEGGGWMAGEVAREKNEEGEPTSFSATSKGTVKRGPGEAWGRGSGPKKSSALETRRVSDEASTAGKPRGFRSAAPHAGGSAKASSFAAAAAAAAKLSASSSVSSPGNSLQGSDFSSRPSAVLGIPPRSVPIATPVAGNGSSVGVSCWGGGRAQSASSQRNQREVSPPAEGVLSSSPRPSGTSRPPGWVKGQSFSAAWVTERGDGNSRKLRGRQMEGDSFRSLLGSDGVGDSIQGTAPSSDGQKTPSAGGCSSTAASSSEAESGQPESVETISSPVEGSKANGRRLSSRSGNDTPAKGLEGNSGPSHQSRPLTPARSGGRVRGYAEVLTSSPTTASSSVLLSPAVGEKFPALGNAGVHMSRSRDGDQTSKEGGQRVEERKDMRPASDGRGSISSTGGQAFAGWNGLPAARRASGTGTSGGLFSPSKQEVPDGEICGAWPRSRRLGCDVGMEGASGTGVSNEEGRLERKMVSASRASPGEAPLTVWKRSRRSSGGDSSTREISEGPRGEDEESNPGESQGATSPGTASTRAAANRGRAEILPSLGLRRGTLYGSRDGSSGDEEVSQARAGSITKSDLRFFPISGMREHEDALLAVSRSNPERCEERKTVDCMPVGGGGRDGHVLGRDLLEEREFQWLSKEDFQQPEGSADFSGDYSSPSFPNLSSRSVGSPVRGGEVLQWLPSSGALSDYPREPAFSLLGVPFSSDTPPLFSSCVLPRSSPVLSLRDSDASKKCNGDYTSGATEENGNWGGPLLGLTLSLLGDQGDSFSSQRNHLCAFPKRSCESPESGAAFLRREVGEQGGTETGSSLSNECLRHGDFARHRGGDEVSSQLSVSERRRICTVDGRVTAGSSTEVSPTRESVRTKLTSHDGVSKREQTNDDESFQRMLSGSLIAGEIDGRPSQQAEGDNRVQDKDAFANRCSFLYGRSAEVTSSEGEGEVASPSPDTGCGHALSTDPDVPSPESSEGRGLSAGKRRDVSRRLFQIGGLCQRGSGMSSSVPHAAAHVGSGPSEERTLERGLLLQASSGHGGSNRDVGSQERAHSRTSAIQPADIGGATSLSSSPSASSSTHSGGGGSGMGCLGSPLSSQSSPYGVLTPQNNTAGQGGSEGIAEGPDGASSRAGGTSAQKQSQQQLDNQLPFSAGASTTFSDSARSSQHQGSDQAVAPGPVALSQSLLEELRTLSNSSLEMRSTLFPCEESARSGRGQFFGSYGGGGGGRSDQLAAVGMAGGGSSKGRSAVPGCFSFVEQTNVTSGGVRHQQREGVFLGGQDMGCKEQRHYQFSGGDSSVVNTDLRSKTEVDLCTGPDVGGRWELSFSLSPGWLRSSGSAVRKTCPRCAHGGVCTVVHVIPDEVEVREVQWSWHGELLVPALDGVFDVKKERNNENRSRLKDATARSSDRGEEETALACRGYEGRCFETKERRMQSSCPVGFPEEETKDSTGEGTELRRSAEDFDDERNKSTSISVVSPRQRCAAASLEGHRGSADAVSLSSWASGDEEDRKEQPRATSDPRDRVLGRQRCWTSTGELESDATCPVRARDGPQEEAVEGTEAAERLTEMAYFPRSQTCAGCLAKLRDILLTFERGEKVEVLVHHRQGWIFGRIRGQPQRQGWFPDYMLQRPEQVCHGPSLLEHVLTSAFSGNVDLQSANVVTDILSGGLRSSSPVNHVSPPLARHPSHGGSSYLAAASTSETWASY